MGHHVVSSYRLQDTCAQAVSVCMLSWSSAYVSSSIGMQDPVSSFFDKTFDGAHNLTVQAGDLKNVRWARIDYLEVTDITTRWGIWKSVLFSLLCLLPSSAQPIHTYECSIVAEHQSSSSRKTKVANSASSKSLPSARCVSQKKCEISCSMKNGLRQSLGQDRGVQQVTGTSSFSTLSFTLSSIFFSRRFCSVILCHVCYVPGSILN